MPAEPKDFTDTTPDDMAAQLADGLFDEFYNNRTVTDQYGFIMNFLADPVDYPSGFASGRTVTIKTNGSVALTGEVVAVSDFGALGVGGALKINARSLVSYIKSLA